MLSRVILLPLWYADFVHRFTAGCFCLYSCSGVSIVVGAGHAELFMGDQDDYTEECQRSTEHARQRLQGMQPTQNGRRFFTSDLTVNEFLLVKEADSSRWALVVGTSIYHIGCRLRGCSPTWKWMC